MVTTDFAYWLQQQLDDRNWKPTDLAKRSHLSDTAVSRILRGQRNPDPETLLAIAKALSISATAIYQRAGLLPEGNGDNKVNETIEQILHEVEGMPEQDQNEILAFIRMKTNLRQRQKKKQ